MDIFRNVFFIDLIAIFRIKTYEDFDTKVPLIGLSIDGYHFMEKKQVWVWGKSAFIFVCINESMSLSKLDQPVSRNTYHLRRGGNNFF